MALSRPAREAGVVEVGARADRLLVASDPPTTPMPLVPDDVMVRGRWQPRHELEARLAEIAMCGAPPDDRWQGAPPLTAGGKVVRRARYESRSPRAIGDASLVTDVAKRECALQRLIPRCWRVLRAWTEDGRS